MTTQTANDDEVSTTTTRRTRADLRYLADGWGHANNDDHAMPQDADRNTRLSAHGWVTSQGKATEDGRRLARATRLLIDRGRFDDTVDDLGGLPMYVDIVTSTEPAEVLTVLNHFRTVRRAVEDARDMVDLPDDYVEGEFEDPDRHFAEYVSHKGRATVRVRFRHEETARTFRYDGVPNDFDALPSHDERFRHNAHTRKVDVAVPIDE